VGKSHAVKGAIHTFKPLHGELTAFAGTGEVGRKDLEILDLAGAEPFPAAVLTELVGPAI
jgi:hypothetical protein